MSTNNDKIKNSKRRQQDENAVKRQLKIAKQHGIDDYQTKTVKEPHRMVKRHAMDCGNPRCFLCGNPRKLHKDKLTAQEKRLFQDTEFLRDRGSNGNIKGEE